MIIKNINIKDIKIKDNIRQLAVEQNLDELMRSIKQIGLMQPIGVSNGNVKNITLIWGWRRLQACKKLGYKTIPAIIFKKGSEMTEEEFLILNTSENIQRKSITIFELGRIIEHFKNKYKMSHSEIGARLSIPTSRIRTASDTYRRVPEKYRAKIDVIETGTERKGKIPLTVAHKVSSMVGVKNNKEREQILDKVSKDDGFGLEKLGKVGHLISAGVPLKTALKEIDNYKSLVIKIIVKQKVLDKVLKSEDVNSISQMVKDALSEKYGKDLIGETK